MEFQPCHHAALTIAGTVALPSPYPASGPVSVVIAPDGDDFEIFVKILQVVSDRRIITRFIRPEDIRAIRAQPVGSTTAGPESWPVLGIKKLKGELDKRAEDLRAKAKKTGALGEAPWYPAAIVYVAESAPVLHRNEVGVTAAVSSEDVAFGDVWSGCCNVASVVQPGVSPDDLAAGVAGGAAARAMGSCCHIEDRPPPSGGRSAKDRS